MATLRCLAELLIHRVWISTFELLGTVDVEQVRIGCDGYADVRQIGQMVELRAITAVWVHYAQVQ